MSRRTTSLLVASIALVAMVVVAFLVPMPYVVQSPGVTENTLGRHDGEPVIRIDGRKTYAVSGHLELTTVQVTSAGYSPRLPDVLAAWISPDRAVVPRDVIYPPEQTVEESEKRTKDEMLDSQTTAIVAGLGTAGIEAYFVTITGITDGAPAQGVLDKGDVITSIDGAAVASVEQAVEAIRAVAPGSVVKLGIERDGSPSVVSLTTRANPEDAESSQIGARLSEVYDPPFPVEIELSQDIGGPSAGLMFALAIYDLLTPGELTGGRFVAGTGTIDVGGEVGEIGGIRQKIVGAYKDGEGATVFLVPAGNCAEAGGSDLADEVTLVSVATIDEAVQALESIEDGDTSSLTMCGT